MRSVLVFVLCALPAPALAQADDPAAEPGPRADLSIQVLDAVSERPIPSARIRLLEARLAALTDQDGRHLFADLPAGQYFLSIEQYGFVSMGTVLDVRPGKGDLQVALEPSVVEIDGLEVVAERIASMERQLRRRRNASAVTTRVFEQDRLLQSSAFDVVEFLEQEPSVRITDHGAYYCVLRRGRLLEPRVYIDEVPIFRGMQQLRFYQPADLHMIEVFAGGTEVRAYTRSFMDRMVDRPIALLPAALRLGPPSQVQNRRLDTRSLCS